MEASELRIGNLLFFENEVQEVSSIHSDNTIRLRKSKECNCHGCYHINNAIIQPIPLTEEWLLNFGFDKLKIPTSLKEFYIEYYKKDNFIVYLLKDSFEVELILSSSKEQFNLFKNFKKEVHILQNLYFALTDEELMIKNK